MTKNRLASDFNAATQLIHLVTEATRQPNPAR
jgi:hypothetical protein